MSVTTYGQGADKSVAMCMVREGEGGGALMAAQEDWQGGCSRDITLLVDYVDTWGGYRGK